VVGEYIEYERFALVPVVLTIVGCPISNIERHKIYVLCSGLSFVASPKDE